jgi:hypothetical protein
MMYVKQIMKLFDINEQYALKVYQLMDLDFSEATETEFRQAAISAWSQLCVS